RPATARQLGLERAMTAWFIRRGPSIPPQTRCARMVRHDLDTPTGGTMPGFKTESIRTVALVGQSASGKTSLSEALLAKASAIGAAGSLERGTTVSDFDPLERKFQHSLAASIMHFHHADTRIHL